MSAATPVRWRKEPEKAGWMLRYHEGNPTCSVADVVEAFESEFGVRLNRSQVNTWRVAFWDGRRRRAPHRTGVRPVWSEKTGKDGAVLVKVGAVARNPAAKDNWVKKHVLEWERANGRPLPPGHVVVFADGDKGNFDPANLVAIPKRAVFGINRAFGGTSLGGRDALLAAAAACELDIEISRAAKRPRACAVCGREFSPEGYAMSTSTASAIRTCPECVKAGKKGTWLVSRGLPEKPCAACGRMFEPSHARQVRCRRCIDDKVRVVYGCARG